MEARGSLRLDGSPTAARDALPPPAALRPAFLGEHPSVLRLLDAAERLARSDQPVLLLGETGTGKELLARILHASSARAGGPFRAVNCAALPAGLLEAELFGAARGAYTGADGARPGLVEAADGGTLFLDEVGDMPAAVQAAVLRVLEDGVTRRLGDTRERRAHFRLLAATNRDLDAMVRAGTFRADLRWRLGHVLRLPSLRERRSDVPLLARAVLAEAAAGAAPRALDASAEGALLAHDFPGNVRELRTMLLAAAALADGPAIGAGDLGIGEGCAAAGRVGEEEPGALRAAVARLGEASVARLALEARMRRRTAQRALAEMVRLGVLVREGRGPATRYRVAAGGEACGPAGGI